MKPTDDALIRRYLAGDDEAFERLYHRHARRLLGFLRAFGDGSLAEDVAQKTWMKVIDQMHKYAHNGKFRPWLFTIAHRLWIDERRRTPRRQDVDAGSAVDAMADQTAADPLDQAVAHEEQDLVIQALGKLPSALRRTVLLRIDGGLKFRQIADAMECPLGTVLWRMKEAERRLAAILAPAAAERAS